MVALTPPTDASPTRDASAPRAHAILGADMPAISGSRMARGLVLLWGGVFTACSGVDSTDPKVVSVYYSNMGSIPGPPGTVMITWLTPGSAMNPRESFLPCALTSGSCAVTWYDAGFRTDTLVPYEQRCVHFVAPGSEVAGEFVALLPGGVTEQQFGGHPYVSWSSDSSWGFDGRVLQPAGTFDSTYGSGPQGVQGC